MKYIYFAVDPGYTGALAVLEKTEATVSLLAVYDTPTIKKKRVEMDLSGIAELLDTIYYGDTIVPTDDMIQFIAVVEQAWARPGEGVVSAGRFMEGYGMWQGLMVGYGLPLHLISPQRWKRGVLGTNTNKDAARQTAGELFPKKADLFKRKKDDGRAEAVLLGYYAAKMGLGTK